MPVWRCRWAITPSGQLTAVQTGHDGSGSGHGTFGPPILAQQGKMSRTDVRRARRRTGRWRGHGRTGDASSGGPWNGHGTGRRGVRRGQVDLERHDRPASGRHRPRRRASADIAPTIAAARELGLPLAIRGGGHNVAGNGTVEGGIVLDLGGLTDVVVDPAAREVRVGPGATLGHLDRATEPHGLAVPVGVVSGTGVAGLTLGGGVGWLTHAYGLTVDNLLAVDVVTASGTTVHASATRERGPVLGCPRRRRQLRGRLVVHVPRPSDRAGHPRRDASSHGRITGRRRSAGLETWSRGDVPDPLTVIVDVHDAAARSSSSGPDP